GEILFNEYVLDCAESALRPPPEVIAPSRADEAVGGLWPSDAARFVRWLNDHVDDDHYRLPTAAELEHPSVTAIVDPERTAWIASDPPRLPDTGGARPFAITPGDCLARVL